MTVADVKQAIDKLPETDRLEIAAYLRQKLIEDDPESRAELTRGLDNCIAGQGQCEEEFRALHERLSDEGR